MLSRHVLSAGGGTLPEFISSSTNAVGLSASNTVTAPTGIQNGDILIAYGALQGSSETISSYPSGFIQIMSSANSALSSFCAYKVAASESGNYTFTWSTNKENRITILVYRNATRINTVGIPETVSTTDTSVAPSITPSFQGVLLSFFANRAGSKTVGTAPSGMTQRAFANTGQPSLAAYDLRPQNATATGTKTLVWTTGAASDVTSLQVQITNEITVVPDFIASAFTQTTSSSSSITINKPTGTVENDLMLAFLSLDAGPGGASWDNLTGWTRVATNGASGRWVAVYYKVAGASEGSSYTFTNPNTNQMYGTILTYRYASYDTIGSFTSNTNPLILPSITTAESQSILLAYGQRRAANITLGTPTGMTAQVTDNDATSTSNIVCVQTVPKGPTGTRSMSTGSSTDVIGILLSIKPTRSL